MNIGDILADRFVVEQLAGSGGMGEIYRASDRGTGRPVAIKVLLKEGEDDLQRFEREAHVLSAIDHPCVVRYVAQGVMPSGNPYLAMEWLEGEDLGARLERGPLGAAQTVALAAGVADALGALHDCNIVHRDLKPSNVFLVGGRVEEVKLLDFGIARSEAAARLTASGVALGTPAYMAPEQASGAATIDARADVFALGCLLFECLTGEKAFKGESVVAILTKILFADAPRLEDKRPELPARLCALVQQMLCKAAQGRPVNGRAVAGALRALDTIPNLSDAETVQAPRLAALTRSEQRAVAVIFVAAPAAADPANDAPLAAQAKAHGGRFERLLDGSGAVLLSGQWVATDLAAQAARCALSLRRHAAGRRIALGIERSEETGRLAVGPVIDRAAKLFGGVSGEPSSGEHILLDAATMGLLDARFEVLEQSGGSWVLRAEREVAEARTLLGKPTPCVGRERDLRQIQESFDEGASERRARAVLVTGPAGMGKSRIGREVLQRLRARGGPLSIWVARGELLGAGSALGMLAELVRCACGIRPGESLGARQDKLRARVAERIPDGERQRVTEFLGEIIGAHFPDEGSLPLLAARRDAQLMGDQIRAAFIDLLRAECEAAPVLILLEDLHWGDGATVRILDAALRDLEEEPLFVLALARPEVHETFPKLWAGPGFEEKRLRQLDKRASEQLVRHVLGERVGPGTVERIVRLADGNAFYLEELIRATAEGNGDDLPGTVVTMVQSRLWGQSEMQRRLLRAASLFGETFWAGGVAALTGVTSAVAGIQELAQEELATWRRQSRFAGEEEYVFRHALVREGAYAMLTEEDRRLGHRLVGQWLEQHGEEDALVLAGHYRKGGDGARAAEFYLRAAELAVRGCNSDGALHIAEQGLEAGASGETRAALLGIFCEANTYGLKFTEASLSHATELMRSQPAGSVPWMQGALLRVNAAAVACRIDDLRDTLRRVLGAQPCPEVGYMLVISVGVGATTLDFAGMVRDANVLFDQASHSLGIMAERDVIASSWLELILGTRVGYAMEDPWDALQHSRRAQGLAMGVGHRRAEGMSRILQGLNLGLLGASADAETTLRGVALADHEIGLVSSFRPFMLAWLLADGGDLDQARSWAERLVEAGRGSSVPLNEARGRWVLAEVLRRCGELAAAEREVQAALAMAVPVDKPGALATLAALRLAQGKPNDARAAAEDGVAKYETMGGCYFFRAAFLRVIHAECLEACGHHDEARAAIVRAKQWLLDIAARIGEAQYRRSFLENVPENRRILELTEQWAGGPPQ